MAERDPLTRRAARTLVRALAVLAIVLGAASTRLPVRAQSLQRLTVESFVLSADTGAPRMETPFHLVLLLKVREHVTEIDNLVLPILAELELQGDERRCQPLAHGTLYRETITVVAHRTGTIVVAPASLQAVDARDGQAKEWFTNGLQLRIGGGSLEPLHPLDATESSVVRIAWRVVVFALILLCAFVLVLFLGRRRRRTPPPVPVPEVPALRTVSRRERLQDALTVLRAERSRVSAVRVRSAVWSTIGASPGETLADVLLRPQALEPRLRSVLVALERAAFTYDADLPDAIDRACVAMQQYLEEVA